MKRLINLTLLFSLIALFSCGNTGSKQPAVTANTITVVGGGKPIQLDKLNFLKRVYDFEKNPQQWTYAGDKPCVIDFYADWCGPCKMIAPYLDEIAAKYDGKVYVYRVNVDNEQELAQFFGIQSIPAVLFCPLKGKPQMMTGARPKEDFYTAVESIIANPKK
jgi:thioredoxin